MNIVIFCSEVPHKAKGQISSLRCPCCIENLMISHEIYHALISREERMRISNAMQPINRHCSTHHEEVPLWIGLESAYLLEDKVSVVFLSQKLICKSLMKNAITDKDIQETISCARSRTLQSKIGLILLTAMLIFRSRQEIGLDFLKRKEGHFSIKLKSYLVS
jgi:hypothetical protein